MIAQCNTIQKLNEAQDLQLDNLVSNEQELVDSKVYMLETALIMALKQNCLVKNANFMPIRGKIGALQVDLRNSSDEEGSNTKLVFNESDYDPETYLADEIDSFMNMLLF